MAKKIELTGQTFNRLTVLLEVGRHRGRVLWKCLCVCGNKTTATTDALKQGNKKSCGCLKKIAHNKLSLIGETFGRLKVLQEIGKTKDKRILWECICECGQKIKISTGRLRQGNTKSCGCWNREAASLRHKSNLVGQTFGRLKVLQEIGRTKHGGLLWECICECGQKIKTSTGSLTSDNTKSCGCWNREVISLRSKSNLVGQTFGRLKVLQEIGRTKDRKVIWECICECGNKTTVVAGSLTSNNTKSCGCWIKESTRRNGKNKMTLSQSIEQFGYLMDHPADVIKSLKNV